MNSLREEARLVEASSSSLVAAFRAALITVGLIFTSATSSMGQTKNEEVCEDVAILSEGIILTRWSKRDAIEDALAASRESKPGSIMDVVMRRFPGAYDQMIREAYSFEEPESAEAWTYVVKGFKQSWVERCYEALR